VPHFAVAPRAAHQRERGREFVQVRPARLQVALAGADERGPPVQDPGVIENEAVPRAELEQQRLARLSDHVGEGPVGIVEDDDLIARLPQRLHVRAAEPDLPDPAPRIDADHRPGGAQLGSSIGVDEGHLAAGQHRERGGVLGAQRRGRVEAVDEYGLAAFGGIVQAMHQLQGGLRVPERLGGARREGPTRERLAGRQRTDPYVNDRPVRGLPHEADALRHGQDHPWLARHVPEYDEPVTQHRGQAGLLVSWLGAEERPVPLRNGRLDLVRGPQPLGVLGAPILTVQCVIQGPAVPRASASPARTVVPDRELAQPADIKGGAVAVRAEHDLHPVARRSHGAHRDISGEVGDAHQPLAVTGIPADRARAVDPQPDRGQPQQRSICAGRRRPGVDMIPRTLLRFLGLACHLAAPAFPAPTPASSPDAVCRFSYFGWDG
jgi:hypothetical protein